MKLKPVFLVDIIPVLPAVEPVTQLVAPAVVLLEHVPIVVAIALILAIVWIVLVAAIVMIVNAVALVAVTAPMVKRGLPNETKDQINIW